MASIYETGIDKSTGKWVDQFFGGWPS